MVSIQYAQEAAVNNLQNSGGNEMATDISSMSNANVGKTFNAIAKGIGRDDLGEILFNWNESELNEDGSKIIGYPGRDGRFSHGKDGGKINISKREFLAWLLSDMLMSAPNCPYCAIKTTQPIHL